MNVCSRVYSLSTIRLVGFGKCQVAFLWCTLGGTPAPWGVPWLAGLEGLPWKLFPPKEVWRSRPASPPQSCESTWGHHALNPIFRYTVLGRVQFHTDQTQTSGDQLVSKLAQETEHSLLLQAMQPRLLFSSSGTTALRLSLTWPGNSPQSFATGTLRAEVGCEKPNASPEGALLRARGASRTDG